MQLKKYFTKTFWIQKTRKIYGKKSDILNRKSTTLEGNVNHINKFYNSTATRATGNEPVKASDICRNITSFPENSTTEQFEVQATNSYEFIIIIKSLHNNCSPEYDNAGIFLIKPMAEYISSPLAFIINNTILTRTFSKRWKISRIWLTPKFNKPETPADYRPISLLPILSKTKVYMRWLYYTKWTYISKKKIIYHPYQSGYRKNYLILNILIKLQRKVQKLL